MSDETPGIHGNPFPNMQGNSFEETLLIWAKVFFVLSIISGFVSFYYAGRAVTTSKFDDWGEKGVSFAWIAVGVATILQGILIRLLLKGLSEIIRLLRKK